MCISCDTKLNILNLHKEHQKIYPGKYRNLRLNNEANIVSHYHGPESLMVTTKKNIVMDQTSNLSDDDYAKEIDHQLSWLLSAVGVDHFGEKLETKLDRKLLYNSSSGLDGFAIY
jgi:hypothetical protein